MGLIFFFVGLLVLAATFGLKYAEINGRVIIPVAVQNGLDHFAESLKVFIRDLRRNVRKLVPMTILVVRFFIHQGALWFAQTANKLEKRAHAIADRVSHKHKFQRQLPRSSYLHKVSEVKKTDDIVPKKTH